MNLIIDITKNKYFYFSLTLSLTTIFILFAIRPALVESTKRLKQLSETKVLESSIKNKVEAIHEVERITSENETGFQKLNYQIPTSPNETTLTKRIELYAKKNGFILSKIDFIIQQEKDLSNRYKTVSFKFTIEGDIEKITTLLDDIENENRLIKIESVKMSKSRSKNAGDDITRSSGLIEINALAFYKIES